MILILKNYPSVVDAKAWAACASQTSLILGAKAAMDYSKLHGGQFILPEIVSNALKQVVGVTFDDAEGAVQQMYGVNWESLVPYGDMILLGNRAEILAFPDDAKLYAWIKNDRGTQMIVVFDIKKYIIPDPNRRSHARGKTLTNFCRPGVPVKDRDENTFTTISLMREDEPLIENDVLSVILSDTTDIAFSAIM